MINEELLKRVLESKEERANFQRQLINKYQLPLISLTLNLVGGYFLYDKWEVLFEKALESIDDVFKKNIVSKETRIGKWGPEGFWIINLPIESIKKETIEIEDSHSLGRLFDIDVIGIDGNSISRRHLGIQPRRCIICDNSAIECYVEKNHELEELKARVDEIILEGLMLDGK
ncbi:citrate lyase holo-[acyl-carrier protein] synthase [Sporanaerobacter acetigenes]|uniref:citrate lyase holo-[acyl-carrier protein] synthase n=1 Tax=Sporanaerobacter acetigenes TaxID=165813 RepID=UPI0033213006